MPFGINLPILNWGIPKERAKVYETYPNFIGWVTSGGTEHANWYK